MADSIKLAATGLANDANEFAQGGAMRLACNVVIRKPGVIEPRQGMRPVTVSTAPGDHIVELLAVGGDMDYVTVGPSEAGGAPYYIGPMEDPANEYAVSDSVSMYATCNGTIGAAESRGNVYYSVRGKATVAGGPRVRVGSGGTVLYPVGYPCHPPPPHYLTISTLGAVAINIDKYVAYRVTLENKIGDVLRVSVPSGRTVVGAGSISAKYIGSTNYYLPDRAAAGDVMRVWRSRNSSSTTPSDQLFLCFSVELTSSHISAGYVAWTDNTADDDLGEALYTNPEREGPRSSNFRPPACDAICGYQGSIFYSATTSPHRYKLRFREGQLLTTSTGIGYRAADGTITGGGAATITGATVTGLKVGMVLSTTTGWTGTGFPRITNINGTTITVTHTYAGGGGAMPGSLYWLDTVRIKCADSGDDLYYPIASPFGYIAAQGTFAAAVTTGYTYATDAHSDVLAYNISDHHEMPSGTATDTVFDEVMLEKYFPDGAYFEVWATHGDEYDPPLPEPTVASGEQSTADELLDAMYFSKRNEPEHVPLGNFIRVGAQGKRILATVPTTDAILVFKEDGVFRVSGSGARSGFRWDPIMPSCVLLTPRCAKEMNGDVFAWTNLGPVAFGAGGFRRLGTGELTSEFARQQNRIGTANVTSAFGVFVAVYPRHSEVLFGMFDPIMSRGDVYDDNDDDYAAHVVVFNANTETWVEWGSYNSGTYDPFRKISAAVVSPADIGTVLGAGGLLIANGDALEAHLEWTDTSAALWEPFVDTYTTLTGESASGTSVTYSGTGSGYIPAAGDVIVNSDGEHRVVTVGGASPITVHAAFTNALGGAYVGQAIKSTVGWQAWSEGHPGFVKFFRSWTMLLNNIARLRSYVVRYRRANSQAAVGTKTFTESTYSDNGLDFSEQDSRPRRVFIGPEAARSSALYVEVEFNNGSASWAIHGATVSYEPISDRVTYGT